MVESPWSTCVNKIGLFKKDNDDWCPLILKEERLKDHIILGETLRFTQGDDPEIYVNGGELKDPFYFEILHPRTSGSG